MLRYTLQRLALAIPTLLVCTAIVFFLGALTGRSYYEKKKADPNVDLAQIRAEEKLEGLDQPLWQQYVRWLARLAFDVHWSRVEWRVQDFEDPSWREQGLRAGIGVELLQTNADAAAGRFALALRPTQRRSDEPAVLLYCSDFAKFLKGSWMGVDARSARSWERFTRDEALGSPLDAAQLRGLRFSLRSGRKIEDRAERCTVRCFDAQRQLIASREMELDAAGRWSDCELPIELAAQCEQFELVARGEVWIDAWRVEERTRRFTCGLPNLGRSAKFDRAVTDVLGPFLANTLLLGVLALLLTWGVALPLGIWCGVHRHGWLDRLFAGAAFLGLSLPSFFVALVVLWFAGVVLNDFSRAHWGFLLFPTGGAISGVHATWYAALLDRLHHLVLPVCVVSIGAIASLQRITRGNLIEVLRSQYLRTARAKGLSEERVIFTHALRNAVNPLITIFGFQLSALLSGAALVEVIFSYPGLGKLVLEAIRDQDRNVVMASVLMSGVLLVLGNLAADLVLAWIDPRVRLKQVDG